MAAPVEPRTSSAETPPTLRERFRTQTRQAILDAARRQIAAAGSAGSLSLNALARDVGMAGPSLYRYFPSRDALLTELIVDGYVDLADFLQRGLAAHRKKAGTSTDPATDLQTYAALYRKWALSHPAVYALLLGAPVPSYHAPAEVTSEPAGRSLAPVVEVVARLRQGRPTDPADPAPAVRPAPGWADVLVQMGIGANDFAAALTFWSALHGLLELELHGHLGQMVADPAALWSAEVARLVRTLAE